MIGLLIQGQIESRDTFTSRSHKTVFFSSSYFSFDTAIFIDKFTPGEICLRESKKIIEEKSVRKREEKK